jgi:hypothetical protein
MIFETQNQLNLFFVFLFFGFIAGIFYLIFLINFHKKLLNLLKNILFYSFFFIFFVFLLNFFNFGKFSLTLFSSYICGYLWIIFILRKLVVILKIKCYTKLNNFIKANKNKRENPRNEQSKKS